MGASPCLALALAALALALPWGAGAPPGDAEAPIDFERQIRPLLADRCYACHGPDAAARQAELRLDRIDDAIAADVIVPGDPDASLLVERIESSRARWRMPPADARLSLAEGERALLRRWIEQGAPHAEHWAFRPLPREVAPPPVRDAAWALDPLDRFVLARLESEGLAPSPAAERWRWLRRVSFDLTGLPPTPEELADFAADRSPQAFERVVDRLLASAAHAERMALPWLDAARYADSYGYQSDLLSPTWPYRDWVVRAFARNLPYDAFLTQQLAGDLLPEADRETRLATAFLRQHRMTNEGGSIAEEWRLEGVADRVQTLGTAVLGLTLECARCHDHKFDPLSQREFYGLSAYFDAIDESGLYHDSSRVPTPTLLLPTPEQERVEGELAAALAQAEQQLEATRAEAATRLAAWRAGPARDVRPTDAVGHFALDALHEDGGLANLARPDAPGSCAPGNALVEGRFGRALGFSGDDAATFPFPGGLGATRAFSVALWLRLPEGGGDALVWHDSGGTDVGYHGVELAVRGERLRLAIVRHWPGNALAVESPAVPRGRWVHVAATYDGGLSAAGLRLYLDGESCAEPLRDRLTKEPGNGGGTITLGQRFRERGLRDGAADELLLFDRVLAPLEVRALASAPAEPADADALAEWFAAAHDAPLRAREEALRAARAALLRHRTGYLEVAVMEELSEPRATHALARGAYDAARDASTRVERGVPAALAATTAAPADRRALARWLTDPDHPLTARVAANRLWQLFFGRGLVESLENFGAQGTPPSHPELLDHLARRLVDSGWDQRALCRAIALSATYRQDSRADREARAADPHNERLARGPAGRLEAEMLRDAALFAAGLLDTTVGGPPVAPYQPAGLWTESNSMSPSYVQSVGRDLYRRSLYTVRKRTAPMPNMATFDAPSREVTCARRGSTSTPLQALVLLDDVQFVEAARVLAERCLRERDDDASRLTDLFGRLAGRPPEARERALLAELLAEQRRAFAGAPERAQALRAMGEQPVASELDDVEVAAWTVVAQTVLNLDAFTWKR